MEIDYLYSQLPFLDIGVIDEIYRTFIHQDFKKESEIDENFNKVTTAVAFCNLLVYEPDSVTEFHKNHLKLLFTDQELADLYKLFDLVLNENLSSSLSAVG